MDLTKNLDKLYELYTPDSNKFVLVEVPKLPFAVIEGKGNPEEENTSQGIKYLLKVITPIKKEAKKKMGKSFIAPPIEILYFADDMNDIVNGNKDKWKYKIMITLPFWIDDKLFQEGIDEAKKAFPSQDFSPYLDWIEEGLCVQIMHKGDISNIPALLQDLYISFLHEENLLPHGAYHEIYLDNSVTFNKKNCKIILRQPVKEM